MRHRHSVWIDVFGVLVLLALLLVPLGILAMEMMGGGGSAAGGGGGAVASSGSAPAPQARSGLRARRTAPASRSPSIFGGGGPATGGAGVEAPFSESWRSEATPDLSGPAGAGAPASGGAPSGGGAIGRAPQSEGPTIASRQPQGGAEGRSAQKRSGRSAWRSEARKLSGRARALSNQLGQMERQRGATSGQAGESSREPSSAKTSSGQSSTGATSNPGTPSDPSQVPLGGAEWLAAAGVAYALNRLRKEEGEEAEEETDDMP